MNKKKTYKEKLDERNYKYRMIDVAKQVAIVTLIEQLLEKIEFDELDGKIRIKLMALIHTANTLDIRIEA